MKVQVLGNGNPSDRRYRDQLGKAAGPLDAHHALRASIAVVVFRTVTERHDACGGNAVAGSPSRHFRSNRIDNAGAIDAWNERQHGSSILLLAGAQADVE